MRLLESVQSLACRLEMRVEHKSLTEFLNSLLNLFPLKEDLAEIIVRWGRFRIQVDGF